MRVDLLDLNAWFLQKLSVHEPPVTVGVKGEGEAKGEVEGEGGDGVEGDGDGEGEDVEDPVGQTPTVVH